MTAKRRVSGERHTKDLVPATCTTMHTALSCFRVARDSGADPSNHFRYHKYAIFVLVVLA